MTGAGRPGSGRASFEASVIIGVALLLAVVFGSRGITSESAVSLQGDMPRYLMNGVFVLDFLAHPSFTIDGILTWAQQYFARYPALSLGHHPPFVPVALVPFYAVFGVSVAAGRMFSVLAFALATWWVFTLGRRLYDARVGGWAALLFATHASIVSYGQVVLSEMAALALVLGALNSVARFRDEGRTGDYLLFIGLAGLSLLAKQLAIFLVPTYLVMLITGGGWAHLRQPRILKWTTAGAVVTAPLVVATLALSPFNVGIVLDVIQKGIGLDAWGAIQAPIWHEHLRPSLGLAALGGLGVALARREHRVWVALCWVASILAGVVLVTGPYDVARYSLYAIPALCLIAALLVRAGNGPVVRVATATALAVAAGAQAIGAANVQPVGAAGYEEAARFVLNGPAAPTVLYSAAVDTGYFVFFIRKHDPRRQLVVLRSDKLLTTSLMDKPSIEERIKNREEIYTLLDRYGTRFVVIEDRPSGSDVIDWLLEEVKSDRFIERWRQPIGTRDRRLRGVDLAVYEYKDAKPGDPDTELDLSLPLIGRDIRVRLSDLAPFPAP